jgi:hypothetical protein
MQRCGLSGLHPRPASLLQKMSTKEKPKNQKMYDYVSKTKREQKKLEELYKGITNKHYMEGLSKCNPEMLTRNAIVQLPTIQAQGGPGVLEVQDFSVLLDVLLR